jgi:hypothetical protein
MEESGAWPEFRLDNFDEIPYDVLEQLSQEQIEDIKKSLQKDIDG